MKTVVLAILDGWGVGENNPMNPIVAAKPVEMEALKRRFPSGTLQASGIAIGLPWGEPGNSETGHLTMGAGRIVYQHYPRISLAIRNGEFFTNQVLKQIAAHLKQSGGTLHLAGLLTGGNVHASFEHLAALLEFARRENIGNVALHLFTDGRDSPPKSGLSLLAKLKEKIKESGIGRIASISGRYYAMDRDGHWPLVERTYRTMTKNESPAASAEEYLKHSYTEKNLTDEFIEPKAIVDVNGVANGDALFFFNFREDRTRELFQAFADPLFKRFPIEHFMNLFVATMTQYEENTAVPAAFPPERVERPLGRIIADNGKKQLRIAETEKYAHVTSFFNGLREAPFPNEYRLLIPSQNVARHDERPEMMAKEITERVLTALFEESFDFILVNYANPDMIAHTGNYPALLKAIQTVDQEIGKVSRAVLLRNACLIITADHGNAERLWNPVTGALETQHDPSPVPVIIVSRDLQMENEPEGINKEPVGILSDIAPTVLALLNLPQSREMTGVNLIPLLQEK